MGKQTSTSCRTTSISAPIADRRHPAVAKPAKPRHAFCETSRQVTDPTARAASRPLAHGLLRRVVMDSGRRPTVRAWQATILLAALFSAATTRAQCAAEMTPDRLHEALAWGLNAPETDLEQYPLRTERTWLINFDTPFLRVAQFSRAMKIQNMPATESDVSPKLAGQEVHVYAHARAASAARPLPNTSYAAILRP